MDQRKDISFRNQMALASLFFFWPLTKWMIKRNSFNLNSQDKQFIEWYIKIWLLVAVLLLIYIAIVLSKYYYRESVLDPISKVLILVILGIIIFWVVWIFSNISIDEKLNIDDANVDKKNIFLKYIPLVNIYLRYDNHNFDKPDFILKEAILLWTIFTLSLATNTLLFSVIIVVIIILRFVSILMWIEIFGKNIRENLNRLFYTNPEEVRGYISGSILYYLSKNAPQGSIQTFIENEKVDYRKLYNTNDIFHIKAQYILLLILVLALVYFNIWNTSILLFAWLILWRYGIMHFKWKHLPSIPIIKEIVFFVIKLSNKFISKK